MEKTGAKISCYLENEDETFKLGSALAMIFRDVNRYPVLMFTGELGAGKTTMIRGIVAGMPGGEHAQVSSPSFNIMNLYPTRPETAHFDLYRLEGTALDPESEEILLDRDKFVLVEWSEFLPRELRPENNMQIRISLKNQGRAVELTAKDKIIQDMAQRVTGLSVQCSAFKVQG
ncbi:MAG: tRNA (adenosine(37)-N6)-threonylcarbamoyltransferase complex ATPase subunit type 1 TsaE [Desulfonatronovibrio sp.]